MFTMAELLTAVENGRVEQVRLHTEDQARFYRYRWLIDGEYASFPEARALTIAHEGGQITVSWAGIIGTGVVTVVREP